MMPEEDPKPKGAAVLLIGKRLPGHQPPVKHVLRNPAVDEEKEDLKRQVAELTDRLQQQQNATPTADDQMALLEKSYELAAKYMNGQDGQSGTSARYRTAANARMPGIRCRLSGKRPFRDCSSP